MIEIPIIQIKAQFTRPSFLLKADLSLHERVTAIFGPSGTGKSTLLSIIAGIIQPDSGLINIQGECLFDSTKRINTPIHHRKIGLVFQESRLFPHLSVEKNLSYGLHHHTSQQTLNMNNIVELLELSTLLKQRPHQLSGGEKQRVALGRALLSSPRLLMLDEPLASLDERLKNQILPFLRLVASEINIPMIYISHNKQEIEQITSNIVLMENGIIKT